MFRQLHKARGFTAMAVLMLAFVIGATTAIFSIVEGVILRPLPFPRSDRLVVLGDRLQGADFRGTGEAGVTAPDIRAYTGNTHSFDGLGGFGGTGFELAWHERKLEIARHQPDHHVRLAIKPSRNCLRSLARRLYRLKHGKQFARLGG